ncbi:MAG: EboA domain-containing protein [Cyanobacteria bacterium J06627_28]
MDSSMDSSTASFDQLFVTPAFLLLHNMLNARLNAEAAAWLQNNLIEISAGNRRQLFIAFSLAARTVGKESLQSSPLDIKRANSIYTGWSIAHWRVDQTTRVLLLLAIPTQNAGMYHQAVMQLFESATVSELVALYQSLAILPYAESFGAQAVEGVRSSMTAVFNAIALNNPYPEDHFSEAAWNQMVLKALFEDSPLHLIQGVSRRANRTLANMLVDYAHERWSAGRSVSPELWRAVGPFAKGPALNALERALGDPDPIQREAAALACFYSLDARSLLRDQPHVEAKIRSGQLNWERIGKLVSQPI